MKTHNQPNNFALDDLYFLEKWQPSNFWDFNTLFRVGVKHSLNSLDRIHADIRGNDVKALDNLFIKLFCCLFFERHRPTNHPIEYYSQWPNISDHPIIFFARYHLGGSVAWTSAGSGKHGIFITKIGQSKINDLYIEIVVKQNILGFQVSMSNLQPVKILYCIEYLIEYPSCRPLFQSYLVSHNTKQLSLLSKFWEKVDKFCSLYDLVEVDDVGMAYSFHYIHFSFDTNLIIFVFNCRFIDNFYGNNLICGNVDGLLHFPECSLPDSPPQPIISDHWRHLFRVSGRFRYLYSALISQWFFFHAIGW